MYVLQDDDYYGYQQDDCLSDSELLNHQYTQQRMDSDNRVVWDWGTLPHENTQVRDCGYSSPRLTTLVVVVSGPSPGTGTGKTPA